MQIGSKAIKEWNDAQDALCENEPGYMLLDRLMILKSHEIRTAWEDGFIARAKGWNMAGHYLTDSDTYERFKRGWAKADALLEQDSTI